MPTVESATVSDRRAPFDQATLEALVAAFEDGSLPPESWDHRCHLAVAAWYLAGYDESEASCRMIRGIRAYNRANGIRQTRHGGYHETITLFWLGVTSAYLRNAAASATPLTLVNDFVERYGERPGLIYEYYSERLVRSWRARTMWVQPGLLPFDL